MASILCRNGSTHTHAAVIESRACWNTTPAPVANDPFDTTPAPAGEKSEPVKVTEGFWVIGEGETAEFFKIQMSGRTERLYGKKLEGDTFEYFASAPRHVAENGGRKLTADDAKWYGELYGRCMICRRTLEDEESIAAGIGPICAGKL